MVSSSNSITLAPGSGSWTVHLIIIYGLAALADRGLIFAGRLPVDAYGNPYLTAGLIRYTGWPVLLLFAVYLIAIILVPRLRSPWSGIGPGRVVFILCTAILTWSYSSYPFNPFFNHSHLDARVVLVVLAVLSVWRPCFVPFFLLLVTAIIHQFRYPLGADSVAVQLLLIQMLLLGWVAWLCKTLTKTNHNHEITILLLVLLASFYWTAGFGKLRLDWLRFGHIHHILHTSYANGWFPALSIDQISTLSRFLAGLDWPMRLFALGIEVGAVCFLWRRWSVIAFLAAWILFHSCVLLMSGIFFWPWISLEIALLLWFAVTRRDATQSLFRFPVFVVSVFLIGLGKFTFHPVNLSWYDSPIAYTFRFEAETINGDRISLPPGYFSPYEYQFNQHRLRYLVSEPTLPISWGAVHDRALAEKSLNARDLEDVRKLETTHGSIRFNQIQTNRFDSFMRAFVVNRQASAHGNRIPDFLRAPPIILSRPDPPENMNEKIAFIHIRLATTLFDGTRHRELEVRPIRTIGITSPPSK